MGDERGVQAGMGGGVQALQAGVGVGERPWLEVRLTYTFFFSVFLCQALALKSAPTGKAVTLTAAVVSNLEYTCNTQAMRRGLLGCVVMAVGLHIIMRSATRECEKGLFAFSGATSNVSQ